MEGGERLWLHPKLLRPMIVIDLLKSWGFGSSNAIFYEQGQGLPIRQKKLLAPWPLELGTQRLSNYEPIRQAHWDLREFLNFSPGDPSGLA